jgi:acyl-CoA synthetase (AMP-forming)/AMP-acid ligase II
MGEAYSEMDAGGDPHRGNFQYPSATKGGKEMEGRWHKVWPAFVPKEFKIEKPLTEYFRDTCVKAKNRVALDFYGFEMSYEQLNAVIDRFAWGLAKIGLKKGDRVALHMQNCPQFIISFFGIHRAGGIVVSLNPMFKHAEIEHELSDSQSEILVGLDYLYPEVEKVKNRVHLKHVILTSLKDYLPNESVIPLPPEAQAEKRFFPGTLDFKELVESSPQEPICKVSDLNENLALLQYTGGTTGLPKGAMITHHALTTSSLGSGYWFNNSENDVYLGVTPFFHIMGMVQMMCAPLLSGGKIVILTRFLPDVVAKAITQYRCTAWVGATTMLIALLQLPDIKNYDMSSFRYICSGGSPVTPEIQKKVKELVPKAYIVDGYGLTESVSQGGAITPLGRFKPGYVGVPHVNDIRIMDLETGLKELPPNKDGEIVIKGPALTTGYWNKPEETGQVIRNGWVYTGDIGSMDEEGYLRYSGRVKEMIKCSGFSVFPSEVEDLLYRHSAVAEVAVIGIEDPYRGESPKAFIVLKSDYKGKVKEEEILEWCKENMAAYKRPRLIEFREQLPKSGAGKILRRILAEEGKNP